MGVLLAQLLYGRHSFAKLMLQADNMLLESADQHQKVVSAQFSKVNNNSAACATHGGQNANQLLTDEREKGLDVQPLEQFGPPECDVSFDRCGTSRSRSRQ